MSVLDISRSAIYVGKNGEMLRIIAKPTQNNFATSNLRRPIFDNVIYVEITVPANKDAIPVHELVRYFAPETSITEPRYGVKYEEFKSYVDRFLNDPNGGGVSDGTAIAMLNLPDVRTAELIASGVTTVEALANVPDSSLSNIGPDGRTLRDKAQSHLSTVSPELDQLRLQLGQEQSNSAALMQRLTTLEQHFAATGAQAPAAPAINLGLGALTGIVSAEVAQLTPQIADTDNSGLI